MRHKIGIFSLFALFTSMLFFRAVDDDGAGGGDSDDIGDFEIKDEDDKTPNNIEKPKEVEILEDEEMKALKEENEKNSKWIEEQQIIIATNEAIATLADKYPNFDADKIAEHLRAIAKEHGEDEAKKLNNPLGWENIYLTKFKKDEPQNPDFDRGRGETKEPYDFKKGFEKAHGGDKDSIADLLENSKG